MKQLFFILTTSITLTLSACGSDSETASDSEQPLRPVRYTTVKSIESATVRTYSGLSRAGQESNLSFRVSGPIQSLPVEVGDQLAAKQLIATIDPAQYRLEAQQAKASLAQTEATLRNAMANFERVKGLYENNNVSRNELDSARANAESSEAQVSAAKQALELAKLNVSYTKLRASRACGVADVLAEVNENITAGQTIVAVTCGEQLEVELDVPESMISRVEKGMAASVSFSSKPGRSWEAIVKEVGVASTTGTTYPVTVELTDAKNGLRSGLAAEVSFAFDMNESSAEFILPAVAVGEDVNGRYVFVVNETPETGVGVIARMSVDTGELTTKGLEIMKGIEAGDKVVVAGISFIRPGLKVMID